MTKPYVEAEVRGKRILRVDAPFDVALVGLRKKGINNPMTAEELAYARTYHPEGKQSSLMTQGSYTKAGYASIKGEKSIRSPNSPLLDQFLAEQATQANRNGKYFVTENEKMYENLAKLAEKDQSRKPEKRRAIILPSRSPFKISPTQNPEVFANILGKAGKEYLSFLGFDSLTVYPVDSNTVDAQTGTILTQEWLAWLDGNSIVDGSDWYLSYSGTVRGVQSVTGEASSQKAEKGNKLVLPYITRDLKLAEKELVRLSKTLLPDQFENLRGLVSKLRGN
jgi:hypothetical protein